MSEPTFIDGLIVKKPHEKAPEFVKCHLSIKVAELKKFLEDHSKEEWLNVDVKESKGGKLYAQLNDWKKEKKEEVEKYPEEEIDAESIPF